MKKWIMIGSMMAVLVLNSMAMAAAAAGDFCGGMKIGTINGLTGKYWLTDNYALDLTAGSWDMGNLVVDASFLMNRFGLFKSDRDDLNRKVTLYSGVGALFITGINGDNRTNGGVKVTAGLAYIFPEPFEIYGEISPTYMFSSAGSFGFMGAIGARYYFGGDKGSKSEGRGAKGEEDKAKSSGKTEDKGEKSED